MGRAMTCRLDAGFAGAGVERSLLRTAERVDECCSLSAGAAPNQDDVGTGQRGAGGGWGCPQGGYASSQTTRPLCKRREEECSGLALRAGAVTREPCPRPST